MGFRSFDNLLHKLNKIEGKLLGPLFDVYRVPSSAWLDWKRDSYKRTAVNASFVFNSYKSNPKWNVPVVRVGVDGRDLLPGDILIDPIQNRTYFLIEREVNRPFEAIQANDIISIATLSTTDPYSVNGNGDWGPNTESVGTDVALNIPAAVLVSSSEVIDGGFIPARSGRSANTNRYQVFCSLPKGIVKNGSIVTYGDNELIVESIFESPAGIKMDCQVVS